MQESSDSRATDGCMKFLTLADCGRSEGGIITQERYEWSQCLNGVCKERILRVRSMYGLACPWMIVPVCLSLATPTSVAGTCERNRRCGHNASLLRGWSSDWHIHILVRRGADVWWIVSSRKASLFPLGQWSSVSGARSWCDGALFPDFPNRPRVTNRRRLSPRRKLPLPISVDLETDADGPLTERVEITRDDSYPEIHLRKGGIARNNCNSSLFSQMKPGWMGVGTAFVKQPEPPRRRQRRKEQPLDEILLQVNKRNKWLTVSELPVLRWILLVNPYSNLWETLKGTDRQTLPFSSRDCRNRKRACRKINRTPAVLPGIIKSISRFFLPSQKQNTVNDISHSSGNFIKGMFAVGHPSIKGLTLISQSFITFCFGLLSRGNFSFFIEHFGLRQGNTFSENNWIWYMNHIHVYFYNLLFYWKSVWMNGTAQRVWIIKLLNTKRIIYNIVKRNGLKNELVAGYHCYPAFTKKTDQEM